MGPGEAFHGDLLDLKCLLRGHMDMSRGRARCAHLQPRGQVWAGSQGGAQQQLRSSRVSTPITSWALP